MNSTQTYDGIDLLKFILCIMIVAVHTELLFKYEIIQSAVKHFNRTSIYFAISTFLYFNKKNNIKEKLFHFLKRIIILYVVWEIIYFPYTWIYFYSFANTKEILFAVLFTGTFGISWFLKALIWGTIILSIIPRKYTLISTIFFSLISIFPIYTEISTHAVNYYYTFIPHLWCMSAGKLIAEKYKKLLFNLKPYNYICFFIIVYCISFLPIPKIELICRLFIPYLILPLFMKLHCIDTNVSKILRKLSVIIYLVHMLFIYILENKISMHSLSEVYFVDSILYYLIILTFSLLTGLFIINIESRIKILRYLH